MSICMNASRGWQPLKENAYYENWKPDTLYDVTKLNNQLYWFWNTANYIVKHLLYFLSVFLHHSPLAQNLSSVGMAKFIKFDLEGISHKNMIILCYIYHNGNTKLRFLGNQLVEVPFPVSFRSNCQGWKNFYDQPCQRKRKYCKQSILKLHQSDHHLRTSDEHTLVGKELAN